MIQAEIRECSLTSKLNERTMILVEEQQRPMGTADRVSRLEETVEQLQKEMAELKVQVSEQPNKVHFVIKELHKKLEAVNQNF